MRKMRNCGTWSSGCPPAFYDFKYECCKRKSSETANQYQHSIAQAVGLGALCGGGNRRCKGGGRNLLCRGRGGRIVIQSKASGILDKKLAIFSDSSYATAQMEPPSAAAQSNVPSPEGSIAAGTDTRVAGREERAVSPCKISREKP